MNITAKAKKVISNVTSAELFKQQSGNLYSILAIISGSEYTTCPFEIIEKKSLAIGRGIMTYYVNDINNIDYPIKDQLEIIEKSIDKYEYL